MPGERSATLVLVHQTTGEPTYERGLLGYTMKTPFERYTTEVLVAVDGDREETDVAVECGGCDGPADRLALTARAQRHDPGQRPSGPRRP